MKQTLQFCLTVLIGLASGFLTSSSGDMRLILMVLLVLLAVAYIALMANADAINQRIREEISAGNHSAVAKWNRIKGQLR